MTRMDFLKQLEYLLQDIDEKDREDALEYYRDYMDEAGISEFASVDGLLDVPEKIAISIRASLNDDSDEQNEFSEQGVSDSRWEPQKHMPDIYKKDDWSRKEEKQTEGAWKEASGGQTPDDERTEWESDDSAYSKAGRNGGNNLGKILLIIVLCIVGLPLIGGIGTGVAGILIGIAGVLLSIVVGVGGGAIGCVVGGVVLFVMSIVHMIASVPEGLLMMGCSFLLLALGILFVIVVLAVCTRLIPWVVRGIAGLFRRIFRRGGADA